MENPEAKEQKEDLVAIMRDEIENAPQKIINEMERGSGNNWLACLVTRLTAVRGYADLAEGHAQLSAEKLRQVKNIVDAMATAITAYQIKAAKTEYPPEEMKNRLMAEFYSILEIL